MYFLSSLTENKMIVTPILLGVLFVSLLGLYLWYTGRRKYSSSNNDPYQLTRYEHNPILTHITHNPHEDIAAFNPSVVLGSDGDFHMLYRAIGSDGVSRLGYAKSSDGKNFNFRLPYPVLHLDSSLYLPQTISEYDFSKNPSGGSSFGLEDPRLTKIGNEVFVFLNIFAGWNFMKIGITKILENDFINNRFKWSPITIISPDSERHKNWTLFPEKINGKYAILHGISPKIMIDYVEDIDQKFTIKSDRGEGTQPGRENNWDTHVRSAGPAPIKTEKGWLVLYHANDSREPHKYKLGAMLLDLQDPTKVLYRGNQPILVPDMHYENEGKPGIVYSCGAVIKNNTLYVYYGGGDKCCCVAETEVDSLLSWLTS
jgi:beta-1,2-mannobiose phosphorylase / 1,2-beta-oligomannan phosphorylase